MRQAGKSASGIDRKTAREWNVVWLLGYSVLGILAFAAYRKLCPEGKAAFFFIFPVHWVVLCFIAKLVTWKGPLLDNPWLWYGILLPILGALACLGL